MFKHHLQDREGGFVEYKWGTNIAGPRTTLSDATFVNLIFSSSLELVAHVNLCIVLCWKMTPSITSPFSEQVWKAVSIVISSAYTCAHVRRVSRDNDDVLLWCLANLLLQTL